MQRNGRASTWKMKTMFLIVSLTLSLQMGSYIKTLHYANTPTDPLANPLDATKTPSASTSSEPDTSAGANENLDMISLRVRPPQSQSEVNGSIGGEKGWAEKVEESPEMQQKRLEGQKRADERELVRCAARRLCAFGVPANDM